MEFQIYFLIQKAYFHRFSFFRIFRFFSYPKDMSRCRYDSRNTYGNNMRPSCDGSRRLIGCLNMIRKFSVKITALCILERIGGGHFFDADFIKNGCDRLMMMSIWNPIPQIRYRPIPGCPMEELLLLNFVWFFKVDEKLFLSRFLDWKSCFQYRYTLFSKLSLQINIFFIRKMKPW
jgi:hypothetical protein